MAKEKFFNIKEELQVAIDRTRFFFLVRNTLLEIRKNDKNIDIEPVIDVLCREYGKSKVELQQTAKFHNQYLTDVAIANSSKGKT